ncbi:glycoside hydrolase N-terminal domain-containing protein [Paenibacillus sp. LHD-117]|uniref:glycosyl hydrolase family 95 catalytic domain-containing protein n=1 Tax=Paenibacillus sp. LHD-117 TaxID=3071412 RepID=UPI0027DEB96E|nr:glycoside hydrolase N-terminal domain-containing protein [Paenibacillus sp. LHD-117]MDQ6421436.1 glycoside hydrolase N-terminal domain-containing protein [Paenibacillus sp. LHD-117]
MANKQRKMPAEQHDMLFHESINRWDEALPLGNGLTGCLVWGDGAPIRLSLDRGDLWDTRLAPEVLDNDFTYKKLIELIKEKNQAEIESKFSDFFSVYPNPTKLPAGRIELWCGSAAERMTSSLNIRTATARVEWVVEGETYQLETYLHADNELGYIRLTGNKANDVQLRLVPPDYSGNLLERENKSSTLDLQLASLGYPKAELGHEQDTVWFRQGTNHRLKYAIVAQKKQKNECEIEWVYTIAASLDGADWFEQARRKVREAIHSGYTKSYSSHARWWDSYWQKSAMTLSEFEFEKQWYWTNYLFGSCSRKGAPPMPLQGVWTADEGLLPPWKGDYHHDLNTELSYWHYLKANHLEEGESFLDFLWELRPAAREFADSFFETPGINLPSVMAIDGKPLGGWPMYSLSPTNQIWLCQAFDHYWMYTGNREFLEHKAYVYLRETAECILSLLHPGRDGKLRLAVSSSPEIHDDRLEAWLTPNSNYDLSLLIYLFTRLEQMAELLDKGAERAKWAGVLSQFDELAANESGLRISPDENLTDSHRHHSHAMAIYPLKLLQYDRSAAEKQIIDDTIAHLESLGKAKWVGYSFAWMAALYTRQGNGAAARYHLQQFWEHTCSPNGFHLNGDYKKTGLTQSHYRPFTLEGNMAAADALQEMLLQTNLGAIRLFPAIPVTWRKNGAEFQGLRGEMGILVSAKMIGGKLEYVELEAELACAIQLENQFGSERLTLEIDGICSEIRCPLGSVFSIPLKIDQTCRIVESK